LNVRPEKLKSALFGGLVLLVFACFAPDLRNGLLDWDDGAYIFENDRIATLSGATVAWAFTETHCGFWAPLTWLSLALDRAAWGLDPFGYHLTNNLLHALNAGLLFLIAVRLLRRDGASVDDRAPVAPHVVLLSAAFAAAVFGLHPLRVESVAWAAERKDVLSMAFGLGAVLAWLGHVDAIASAPDDGGGWLFLRSRRYWAALLLFALSLMSKAMMVTLPLVLLLVDWAPLGRLRRHGLLAMVREKVPMLLLAGLSAWITTWAMAPEIFSLERVGLSSRALVAIEAITGYLRLTLLPGAISPVYLHPGNVRMGVAHAADIALIACLTVGALLAARRWPAILAAWLVFLGALVPFLGFLQNGPQAMAARFTYFPSAALCALLGGGASLLWTHAGRRVRVALPVVMFLTLAVLAAITVRDIGTWRSNVSLWSRAIDLQPRAFGKPYYQRATYLIREGRFQEALADADEALAIAGRKGYPGIHENYAQVARIRRDLGDLGGATEAIGKAIEASGPPLDSAYRFERAALYEAAGKLEEARREREAARSAHGGR
jgi:hypothetical protein